MGQLEHAVAAVAARHPTLPAVRDPAPGGLDLTYAQLWTAASQLAAELAARARTDPAVRPADRILCVVAPRSAFAVTAAVAAATAGFAACFVNPAWPRPVRVERARWAQWVLDAGQARFEPALGGFTGYTIAPRPPVEAAAGPWPDAPADPGAFAVTTSGSTGRPRTVVVGQDPLVRLIGDVSAVTGIRAGSTWSWSHELSFDFAMWEMWGSLLTAGKLVIGHDDVVRDPRGLLALAEQERVQVLSITPRHLEELCLATDPGAFFPDRAVVGGDLFADSVAAAVTAAVPSTCAVFNLYGISEGTIHTTCHRLAPAGRSDPSGCPRSVPIGPPLPGRRVRLVDARGADVVRGEGELLIEGDGVTYGYVGDPEATRERFYSDAAGRPGFRTRDLGVLDERGRLFVTGRLDRQLKVRGMRVDPSEVEYRLAGHPAVSSALVQACRGGLHAYVTLADPGAAYSEADILHEVNTALPQHRVRHLHPVARLPLSPRGKPDPGAADPGCDRDRPSTRGGHAD
jgi:non-ribosomal peptide synthetase component F